jgi:putative ABC transport system permease protein
LALTKTEGRRTKDQKQESNMLNNLRYAIRILVKQPSYSLIAILTLGLGIGASTAIFAVVNGVLLRPLPFKESKQLVMVWLRGAEAAGGDRTPLPVSDLNDWRAQSRSFDSISAYQYGFFNYLSGSDPEQVRGASVTSNLLSTLGVGVQLGRDLMPADEVVGAARVALLSDSFWRTHFNSDPTVIGRTINLNGNVTTIVGVLPPHLNFPDKNTSFWRAIQLEQPTRRGPYFLTGVARLRQGVDIQQATIETRSAHSTFGGGNFHFNILSINDFIVGNVRAALLALLVAVTLVLLIAAVNVANLTLVRGASRINEMTIRKALGASQLDILRQLLTEGLVLALLGSVVGIVLAFWGVSLIERFGPENLPRMDAIRLDPLVLLWTAAMSIFAGVVFGLMPAVQFSRLRINLVLGASGTRTTDTRGKKLWSNTFVVTEMALAVILVVGGGLLVRSFWRLQHVNVGIDADKLLTMQIQLRGQRYEDEHNAHELYSRLLERVQALPGVRAAGISTSLPPDLTDYSSNFTIEGNPPPAKDEPRIAYFIGVSSDYFKALNIQLHGGRFIDTNDIAGRPNVVLINETLRRTFFGPINPISKRLNLSTEKEPQWYEIVGVVADVKYNGLAEDVQPAIYLSTAQVPTWRAALIVKTDLSDPLSLTSAIRREVQQLDPQLPIAEIATMDQKLSAAMSQPRFRTSLVALFALNALLLACVGIYGVISYSVAQRTHEIGIRMALGAQKQNVLYMIIKQGLTLTIIGVGLGVTASYFLTRLMSSLLFGVAPTDLVTFVFGACLLVATALLGTYLPARRATRVDPLVALRYE